MYPTRKINDGASLNDVVFCLHVQTKSWAGGGDTDFDEGNAPKHNDRCSVNPPTKMYFLHAEPKEQGEPTLNSTFLAQKRAERKKQQKSRECFSKGALEKTKRKQLES